ncbi:MAG: amidohydrolase [Actinomycetota bacterium]|nr:amidohydrolase [Actinomycetota bacterium]
MTGYDIVDAQVHLTRDFGPEQIRHSMEALGIRSVMIDEFWGVTPEFRVQPGELFGDGLTRPVSPTAHAMALETPDRISYLQRVERRDPLLREVMALLGASQGARAVRVTLHNTQEREGFSNGAYDEVFQLAVEHDLPLCVLGPDVTTLAAILQRFPALRIVLDHCGWPRHEQHWRQILAAAELPTVVLKWSHTGRAVNKIAGIDADAPGSELDETLLREFDRALDRFGAQRIMWASDVTQEKRSWAQLLAFVTHHRTLPESDKQWVLAGTARDVFSWPATPPDPSL